MPTNRQDPRTWSSWCMQPAPTRLPLYIPVSAARELAGKIGTAAPRIMHLYLISRNKYHNRGGWFSPAEFMDYLSSLGWQDLGHGPGNHRRRFWRALEPFLEASGLFCKAGAGNWQFKALSDIPGGDYTSRFNISDVELNNRTTFNDLFFASLFVRKDGLPVTVPQVVRLTGKSRAQLFRILKRLIDAKRITRVNNIIEAAVFDTIIEAERFRRHLVKRKRVATPPVLSEGGKHTVCVYAGNSYFAGSDAPDAISRILRGGGSTHGVNRRTPGKAGSWFTHAATFQGFNLLRFTPLCDLSRYISIIQGLA